MSRENISIARAKFRNRTLLQVMETRYLLRNKIFEENIRIFGPPMVSSNIFNYYIPIVKVFLFMRFIGGEPIT